MKNHNALSNKEIIIHKASFRDPSGFIFSHNNTFYRQINTLGSTGYEALMSSGLYNKLINLGWLIQHKEANIKPPDSIDLFKIICPQQLFTISYPYEWCFGQIKDAALLTLDIQLMALRFGMYLKDASAYNIQYNDCKPIFIDTLSFDIYKEGEPWPAYRQFCSHFLAPLALMAKRDIRLSKLLQQYIDGIPLDLASTLLPRYTYLNPGLLAHIHLHAGTQKRYASGRHAKPVKVSKIGLEGLLTGLRRTLERLCWTPAGTQWANYYDYNNYSNAAFQHKCTLVDNFIERAAPDTVWDLGANTGAFSRVAATHATRVLSFDVDPAAVEIHYNRTKKTNQKRCLPLLMDVTSPSPAIGWAEEERDSLSQRGPCDTIMMLAMLHHLVLTNNIPFVQVRDYIANLCQYLIIEFVPLSDSQAKKLVWGRESLFPQYQQTSFEQVFLKKFDILESKKILETDRVLYLMKKKEV